MTTAKNASNRKSIVPNEDLGYLGVNYQLKLVKLFLEDSKFFTAINPIVDQNMFTEDTLRRIVGFMKDRYRQSGVPPTYIDMDMYIRANVSDAITLNLMISTMDELREMDMVGQDLVKSEADKFFKQQNLTKAINKATEIIREGNASRYYDIEQLIADALNVNVDLNNGYNPMDGIEVALENNYRKAIPTGYKRLDKALYGGLGAGELGLIIAPSGVGKTSVTTGFAASAATYQCKDNDFKGYKVLHIHFEDEDVNIKRKYYGWVTGVDAIDLSKPEYKETVMNRLSTNTCEDTKLLQRNVWCFHLPSGEYTVNQIEGIIKMGEARGFHPDLMILDYFECLRYEAANRNDSEWTMEGNTMRQLEALAHTKNIAIWVPIQGTKDSFDKEILGLSSAGGSVKKVQIGHVIITLARTQEQKKTHRMTVSIEKFRAGRMDDTVMANIEFNNGTCRFNDDTDTNDYDEYVAEGNDFNKTRGNVANMVMQNRKK